MDSFLEGPSFDTTGNLWVVGGPDRKTLYITGSETGTILTARLEAPGRVMSSHMA